MKLKGEVKLPVVGPVDKRILIGVGAIAAAFVGWKYYQARMAPPADDTEPVDPGFEDPGVLPPVDGAAPGDNNFGIPDNSTPTQDSFGFTGTTNSQWTQYVATQLSQSDTWSYTVVVTALGNFLNNKPLDTTQQQIVQAGIALAGYPPEGSHVIIPGGGEPAGGNSGTTKLAAPTGVKVTKVGTTTVDLSWTAVDGATGYRVYRNGVSQNVAASLDTVAEVGGLEPNTSYSFQVAATGATEADTGGRSASVSAKTTAITVKAPTGVKVSAITATTARVSWTKVTGAQYYRIYINGVAHGAADGGLNFYDVQGLKGKTKYTTQVAADTTNQLPGPASTKVSFTTK